jgi:transcriptional regulator with XRE-family HTH domain
MMVPISPDPTGRLYRRRKAGSAGPLATAIGRRILDRRVAMGWTQHDLSRQSGLSVSYISDVENGQRGMSVDTLLAFAKALGIRTDRLIGE